MDINYDLLPEHMRDGFRRYIEVGIPGGHFMTAVLSNDLMGAFGRADDINRAMMHNICAFLYNDAPRGCYGSPEHVKDWIAGGGLAGIARARELPEEQRDVLKIKGMI